MGKYLRIVADVATRNEKYEVVAQQQEGSRFRYVSAMGEKWQK
jgi:TusA-related sulfurtransferase